MGSLSLAKVERLEELPDQDEFRYVRGNFADYEAVLRIRGDHSGPRISYLDGVIEIMCPGREHEGINGQVGRLVEVFCLHHDIPFEVLGSWTIKERKQDSGVEPDECYVFNEEKRSRPDLAIEVIWTSCGLDKLEIYRRHRVPEVWIWERGKLQVFGLRGDRYVRLVRSAVLKGIDLVQLAGFVDVRPTSAAIKGYRAALALTRARRAAP